VGTEQRARGSRAVIQRRAASTRGTAGLSGLFTREFLQPGDGGARHGAKHGERALRLFAALGHELRCEQTPGRFLSTDPTQQTGQRVGAEREEGLPRQFVLRAVAPGHEILEPRAERTARMGRFRRGGEARADGDQRQR
jgi:hypothetical protein